MQTLSLHTLISLLVIHFIYIHHIHTHIHTYILHIHSIYFIVNHHDNKQLSAFKFTACYTHLKNYKKAVKTQKHIQLRGPRSKLSLLRLKCINPVTCHARAQCPRLALKLVPGRLGLGDKD